MAEPTEGTPQVSESIRDAVTAAFTEHGVPGEIAPESKPAKVAPEVESEEPESDAPAGEPEASGRARGPDGKFAKPDGEKPEADEPATEGKPVDAEGDKPAEPAKGLELPANWSAADRTAFKALPPEGQKVLKSMIDRQEADYTKKTQAIAALRSDYEPVDKMFAPYKEQMRLKGFTPKSVIEAWANVERRLVEGDGHNIIAGMVKSYNIPIEKIADALGVRAAPARREADAETGPETPQGQAQLPPEILQELRSLRDRQDAIDRERQDGVRRSHLEREQSYETRIQNFKGAVNDKGELLHPHFDDVEDAMVLLAQGYSVRKQPIPDVERLYEDAVWANPSTREKLRTAEMQSAEAKRKAEARAKAEKARAAGSSVTGAPGHGQMPDGKSPSRSLREELVAASAE